MNTLDFDRIATATITPDAVDAMMARARADRSEALAALLLQLPALFGRLAARLHPSRDRLPQTGAWASPR